MLSARRSRSVGKGNVGTVWPRALSFPHLPLWLAVPTPLRVSCLDMSRPGGGGQAWAECRVRRERERRWTRRYTETQTKARQREQSWCLEPFMGRGLLFFLPFSASPALPLALSLCVEETRRPSLREGLGAQV